MATLRVSTGSSFFSHRSSTEIYTLSLHDALPISDRAPVLGDDLLHDGQPEPHAAGLGGEVRLERSEEHTSELQSLAYLVCRLLLEKKKKYLAIIVAVRLNWFVHLTASSSFVRR